METDQYGVEFDSAREVLVEAPADIERYTVPDGVTLIDEYAFAWCKSLSDIVIPDSVTQIASKAFIGCESLERVVLPGSVTWIGEKAFHRCPSLVAVTCRGEKPPRLGMFNFVSPDIIIHVPKGCARAYAQAWGALYSGRISEEEGFV